MIPLAIVELRWQIEADLPTDTCRLAELRLFAMPEVISIFWGRPVYPGPARFDIWTRPQADLALLEAQLKTAIWL